MLVKSGRISIEDSTFVITTCIRSHCRFRIFLVLNDPQYRLPSIRCADGALKPTRVDPEIEIDLDRLALVTKSLCGTAPQRSLFLAAIGQSSGFVDSLGPPARRHASCVWLGHSVK